MPSSKRCLLYIITDSFEPHTRVSIESFRDTSVSEDFDIVIKKAKDAKEIYARRPVEVLNCFTEGYEQVFFLGSDVVFYQDSYSLFDLAKDYDVMVTPHCRTPMFNPERYAWMRLTGQYNSDFVIWNNTHATEDFLIWQARMLEEANLAIPTQGYFYDQGYLDSLPILCKTLVNTAFKHNVAWYNLHETTERDIASFQFSGYNPHTPATLSKYAPIDQQMKQPLHITKLLLDYHSRLIGAGWK